MSVFVNYTFPELQVWEMRHEEQLVAIEERLAALPGVHSTERRISRMADPAIVGLDARGEVIITQPIDEEARAIA